MDNVKSRSTLPYPKEDKPLVAEDGLSFVSGKLSEAKVKAVKDFPYRSIVRSLQYLQVHTGVTTAYLVSVLSRFTNDQGPRHIKY